MADYLSDYVKAVLYIQLKFLASFESSFTKLREICIADMISGPFKEIVSSRECAPGLDQAGVRSVLGYKTRNPLVTED